MTKKHFIKFANHIKKQMNFANAPTFSAGELTQRQEIRAAQFAANMICDVQDNPNFDRARFMKACGLD